MYVVLLDNNRSNILQYPQQRQALGCIRCGACLNACPVYKNIGGHSYNKPYPGPIGSVIMPFMENMDENIHLSYASSLCGNCTEVCPVKINLHHLLLLNRQLYVRRFSKKYSIENFSWFLFKKAMLSRKNMNRGSTKLKARIFKFFFKEPWGKRRSLPQFPEKSFNQMWIEKYGYPQQEDKKII
jgi:L-lactate dehydrogenase complex protein LldF